MITLNKIQLLNEMDKLIQDQNNTTKKAILQNAKKFISKSNIDDYYTIKQNDHINLGYVFEKIALNYFNLLQEDDEHEIKSFIVNGWNILTNKDVRTVYIVVCINSPKLKNGFYKINADLIRNKRVGLKELVKLNKEYVCSLTTLMKGWKPFFILWVATKRGGPVHT